MLGLAVLGLSGNFVIYVIALGYASPTINQVVTQLSPILLMLGGIAVFHERFSAIRWAGFALLLVGLPLFFNHRSALSCCTFARGSDSACCCW